jgi:uroporphyrinogen-III synthase
MKVWITRAAPGASETAKRLIELGHEPLVAPLLTVRRLLDANPDLTGIGALAFTSANGVRAFADVSDHRTLPVFAVGEATAAAARQAGFADVHAGPSDVAALATAIAGRRGTLQGAVLHASAAEPAGDLAGALQAAGVAVRSIALYQTVAADPPGPALRDQLSGAQAILLHSPKAARALASLAATASLDLSRAHLVALSPACLAPLANLPTASRQSATAPNEADLLALLETLSPEAPPRPVLSPLVWGLLLFGALCILAGATIGLAIAPAPAKHLPPVPAGTPGGRFSSAGRAPHS